MLKRSKAQPQFFAPAARGVERPRPRAAPLGSVHRAPRNAPVAPAPSSAAAARQRLLQVPGIVQILPVVRAAAVLLRARLERLGCQFDHHALREDEEHRKEVPAGVRHHLQEEAEVEEGQDGHREHRDHHLLGNMGIWEYGNLGMKTGV